MAYCPNIARSVIDYKSHEEWIKEVEKCHRCEELIKHARGKLKLVIRDYVINFNEIEADLKEQALPIHKKLHVKGRMIYYYYRF